MNNNFTPEKIEKLANLLMIGVTPEEKEMVSKEFTEIDTNINKLNDIANLKDIEPMTHCLDDFTYELRSDDVNYNALLNDILSNCDNHDNGEVIVPRAVGTNE